MFADDVTYTFSTIILPGVTNSPEVNGINDRGDIVGSYSDGGPQGHGFIDHHGHITTLDVPGATFTDANGINDRGDVVGTYVLAADGPSISHGFLYQHGRFETIDLPGADRTEVFGINNRGALVGFASGGTVGSEGFLFQHGHFTAIAVPDDGTDFTTEPRGINDQGQIVGDHGMHGFLYDHGVFTPISVPGAFFTDLYGINNLGQIVGDAATARGVMEGVLYDHGHFSTVDFPVPNGPPESSLRGINDAGAIVGISSSTLAEATFLATPHDHGHGGKRHDG